MIHQDLLGLWKTLVAKYGLLYRGAHSSVGQKGVVAIDRTATNLAHALSRLGRAANEPVPTTLTGYNVVAPIGFLGRHVGQP